MPFGTSGNHLGTSRLQFWYHSGSRGAPWAPQGPTRPTLTNWIPIFKLVGSIWGAFGALGVAVGAFWASVGWLRIPLGVPWNAFGIL